MTASVSQNSAVFSIQRLSAVGLLSGEQDGDHGGVTLGAVKYSLQKLFQMLLVPCGGVGRFTSSRLIFGAHLPALGYDSFRD